jgi:hypothetical protein
MSTARSFACLKLHWKVNGTAEKTIEMCGLGFGKKKDEKSSPFLSIVQGFIRICLSLLQGFLQLFEIRMYDQLTGPGRWHDRRFTLSSPYQSWRTRRPALRLGSNPTNFGSRHGWSWPMPPRCQRCWASSIHCCQSEKNVSFTHLFWASF